MKDDQLDVMYEIADAVFRRVVEGTAFKDGISPEEAHEGMWSLFEHGMITLVKVPGRDNVSVELCGATRSERRAAAARHRPLVQRRMAAVHAS
jgi:hypothetical protein